MARLTFALAAAALAGCASAPHAILDTRERIADDRYNQRVFIRGVDGQLLLEQTELELSPGVHELRLRSRADPVGEVPFNGLPFTFEAKPCVRHFLSAQHEPPPGRGWTLRVIREEPIEDCP